MDNLHKAALEHMLGDLNQILNDAGYSGVTFGVEELEGSMIAVELVFPEQYSQEETIEVDKVIRGALIMVLGEDLATTIISGLDNYEKWKKEHNG